MAEIRVEKLCKNFTDFVAVKESSFVIHDGEFFVMLGPSGCGKTTTLRMIAGLELPSSGKILLGGNDVTFNKASDRDIAFVFQLFALYPHMNVQKNIAFPLKCQGIGRAETRKRVQEVASMLRIEHLLKKPVSGLAGGDRQRVALGRAIVRRPQAFLMDEPLGTLDAEFRNLMCNELRDLHDRINATTVYVTHDQIEAMSMGDKIAVMNNGVIEQFGKPQTIYNYPATMFVADFIGSPSMNLHSIEGEYNSDSSHFSFNGLTFKLPKLADDVAGDDIVIGIRPEHIRIDDGQLFRGSIISTEYLGTNQILTINTDYGILKAITPANQNFTLNDNIGLQLDSNRISVFKKSTGLRMNVDTAVGGTDG